MALGRPAGQGGATQLRGLAQVLHHEEAELLGADVVGDPETRAIAEQRKRMRKLHKEQVRKTRAAQAITSGESAA